MNNIQNEMYFWTDQVIIRFLKKIESIPCLWNKHNKNYSKALNRAAGLYELAQYMNMPGCGAAMMNRKMCQLRGAFIKEKRRMYRLRSAGKEFIPGFSWFNVADAFWGKVIRIRNFSFYSDENANQEGSNPTETTVSNGGVPTDTPTNNTPLTSETLSMCLGKAVNAVRNIAAMNSGNEFDAFGRSVASQLKNIPLQAAYELQSDIQMIITKKKIEHLLPVPPRALTPAIIEIHDDEPDTWAKSGPHVNNYEVGQKVPHCSTPLMDENKKN